MAGSPSYPAPGPSSSYRSLARATALIVAADAPSRVLAVEHCRAEIARLAALRRQLVVFHEADLPAFRTWLFMKFAKRLGELRALRDRTDEQRAILAELDEEVVRRRIPPHKAYRAVLLRRQAEGAGEAEALFDGAPQRPCGRGGSRGLGDSTELWLEATAGADAADAPCGLATFDRCFGTGLDIGLDGAGNALERLRACYRRLVRALHPDLNPEADGEARDLWLEVQGAYRDRDADRLEAIAAGLQIEAEAKSACGSALRESPLPRLRDVKREAEARLRAVRREIARLERHPGWGFSTRSGRAAWAELRSRVTTDLAVHVRRARRDLADARARLKSLAKAPRPPARRRRDDDAQLQFDF